MDSLSKHTPTVPDQQAVPEPRRESRKPYTAPAVIHELNLEARAGSPNFIVLPPGANPFDLGQP